MMKALQRSDFVLCEYKRQEWIAAPASGTTLEQVLNPLYWAHISGQVNVGDRIDVCPADQAWFAQLLVISKPATPGLKVALLSHTDLAAVAEHRIEFGGHILKFEGPVSKWSVTRKARGGKPDQFIRDGFASSEDARDYVKQAASSGAAA